MARVTRKRKPDPEPQTPLETLMQEHLNSLRVRGYSEHTVKNRLVHIGFFIQWAYEHGLREPHEITRPVLERYQRWRRFDTMAMGAATNTLNFLFSNESTLLRTVRDIGLGLVDRAPPLKNLFIRQAAGLAGEVPRLLKGEAL